MAQSCLSTGLRAHEWAPHASIILLSDLQSLPDYNLIFGGNLQDCNSLKTQEFFYLPPFLVTLLLPLHATIRSGHQEVITMLSCVSARVCVEEKRQKRETDRMNVNEWVWPCFAFAIREIWTIVDLVVSSIRWSLGLALLVLLGFFCCYFQMLGVEILSFHLFECRVPCVTCISTAWWELAWGASYQSWKPKEINKIPTYSMKDDALIKHLTVRTDKYVQRWQCCSDKL